MQALFLLERPMLIYFTVLATRGKHPNWLLGGVFPTTYILGGIHNETHPF